MNKQQYSGTMKYNSIRKGLSAMQQCDYIKCTTLSERSLFQKTTTYHMIPFIRYNKKGKTIGIEKRSTGLGA